MKDRDTIRRRVLPGIAIIVIIAALAAWHISRCIKVDYPSQRPVLIAPFKDSMLYVLPRTTLNTGKRRIVDIAFSADGETLYVAIWDGTIYCLDTQNFRRRRYLRMGREIEAIATDPNGQRLAVALNGLKGGVFLVDTKSWRKRTLSNENHIDVRFSSDGKLLAAAGEDGTARVWNIASGKLQAEFPVAAKAEVAAFTNDSSRLFVGGHYSFDFGEWDLSSGRRMTGEDPEVMECCSAVISVDPTSDGGLVLSSNGHVSRVASGLRDKLWSFLADDDDWNPSFIYATLLSSDESLVFATGSQWAVWLIDATDGTEIGKVSGKPLTDEGDVWAGTAIDFAQEKGMLAVGTHSGDLHVWWLRYSPQPEAKTEAD